MTATENLLKATQELRQAAIRWYKTHDPDGKKGAFTAFADAAEAFVKSRAEFKAWIEGLPPPRGTTPPPGESPPND